MTPVAGRGAAVDADAGGGCGVRGAPMASFRKATVVPARSLELRTRRGGRDGDRRRRHDTSGGDDGGAALLFGEEPLSRSRDPSAVVCRELAERLGRGVGDSRFAALDQVAQVDQGTEPVEGLLAPRSCCTSSGRRRTLGTRVLFAMTQSPTWLNADLVGV